MILGRDVADLLATITALKARVAELEKDHCEMCDAVESQYRIGIEALTAERDKLAAQVEKLKVDGERLDWLGNEVHREMMEALRVGGPRALFRRNQPITRETIDAAMKGEPE